VAADVGPGPGVAGLDRVRPQRARADDRAEQRGSAGHRLRQHYDVTLRYSAGPHSGAPADRNTRVTVNGSKLTDLSLPGTANWDTFTTRTVTMYLSQGINRIYYGACSSDDSDNVTVDAIDVTSSTSRRLRDENIRRSGIPAADGWFGVPA